MNTNTDSRTQRKYKNYAEGAEETSSNLVFLLRPLRNLCALCVRLPVPVLDNP